MNKLYKPSGIPLVSAPVTANNKRNADNHPAVELGICTPSQLISYASIEHTGTICVIGNHARGITFASAMVRRSSKPFLIIGPQADAQSAFMALKPNWIIQTPQQNLPSGNGALLLTKPSASYIELCEYIEEWSRNYFIILHLSGGVQVGPELLNNLSATDQCMVFCDSVTQGIRNCEARTISPKEFMAQMSYLLVFSAGVATKDLVELLPTYQYENVSNTTSVNGYTGWSIFHPFRAHRGYGGSIGQTRSMEYKKNIFEADDLQKIFDSGIAVLYAATSNMVFVVQVV